MKISDEIREWCDESDSGDGACDDLRELADRIDRETVELPKDRDGVPIHIGDTVYGKASGKRYIVKRLHLAEIWGVQTWGVSTYSDGFVDTSSLTHERPDSLERIADELQEWSETVDVPDNRKIFDGAAEFADRIRKLAAKKEG